MDAWEWTKVGTAVCGALLVILGGSFLAGQAIDVDYPERQGYPVEGVAPVDLAAAQRSWPSGLVAPGDPAKLRGYMADIENAVLIAPAAGTATAAPAAPVDLGTLLAAADAGRGESVARVCGACHTFDQGGADRIGPNLWAVVGRRIAGKGGFAYSPALVAHGGAWTWEELDRYLASPSRAFPGNRMAFNGIRNPKDRANLLAYLGSLGGAGMPYPAPQPVAAPEPVASADPTAAATPGD